MSGETDRIRIQLVKTFSPEQNRELANRIALHFTSDGSLGEDTLDEHIADIAEGSYDTDGPAEEGDGDGVDWQGYVDEVCRTGGTIFHSGVYISAAPQGAASSPDAIAQRVLSLVNSLLGDRS